MFVFSNDFAQNYFADSLEIKSHATPCGMPPKGETF